jgi:transposase
MSSQSTTTSAPVTPETTVIGVDLGVTRLLVAAPDDAGPDVPDALVVGGGIERDLYDGLGDTLNRLDSHPAETTEAEAEAIKRYRSLLRQRFTLAAQSLVEYADHHDADIVALEDIEYEGGTLAECARGRTKAGEWVLPTFRDHLEAALGAKGFQVERVNAAYSTQQCHVCGELTEVSRATISCDTEDCPVDGICRDRSAAATLAKRIH